MGLQTKCGARILAAVVAGVGLAACSSGSSKSSAPSTSTTSTSTAKSAASLTARPDSGLVGMQSVSVTGSGFHPSSEGTILECNGDPQQPTVALGAPVDTKISVGCTAPAITAVVGTSSNGTVSTTYAIVQGTVGPPCGTASALAQCPATDSAGASPAAGAAAFPCPPTPAQQAAGVVCVLTFGDAAGDTASAPISFAGEKTS